MEPLIRSHKGLFEPHGASARLIWLDDNPPTCTMTYLEIDPGKTSPHHIHEWEHEVYIIEGTGTLTASPRQSRLSCSASFGSAASHTTSGWTTA